MSHILRSGLAGTWYPGDAAELRAEVRGLLNAAPPPPPGDVAALIVPHAGYAYSGRTAAAAYRAVEGDAFDRVVLLGPSHRLPLADKAVVPRAHALRTLLGEAPLDEAAAERLLARPGFADVPAALPGEHSVEIQFPFLQTVLPGVPVLPVVVGRLSRPAVERLARGIRPELADRALLVVSTDFTHFGHAFGYVPFTDRVEARLRTLDLGAFACLRQHDLDGFLGYLAETGATICGSDPLALLLALLQPGQRVDLLGYTTSGRLTGDWTHTVSYLAAAVTGPWDGAPEEDPP